MDADKRRSRRRPSDGGDSGARKLVPPGGHVLGIYARTDAGRGVFKAPANEIARGAMELQVDTADGKQGSLNTKGIHAIHRFPAAAPACGARAR
jgi:phage tail sheath protein FI